MYRLFKSFKFYCFLIFSAILVITMPYFFGMFFLPNEVHIIAGEEHSFEFNMPVVVSIAANENDAAININNERLKDGMSISLNEPFSIKSDKECTVDMKLSYMGIPVKNVKMAVLPDISLVPCGMTVGVRIDTDGIMVLGTDSVEGSDGKVYKPAVDILEPGDLIKQVNGINVYDNSELISIIEKAEDDTVNMNILRDGHILKLGITPVKSKDGKNKIGIWVRDSTQGIGTITYYNDQTMQYGALGHGISDVDTRKIISVKDGSIMESNIVSVKKGKKGSPGELLGDINKKNVLGTIERNNDYGIYGKLYKVTNQMRNESIPIALQNEVKEGPAVILSNVEGEEVKEYDVYIENVNRYKGDTSKSMVIKITDKELLKKTNGIVQGMSGSPIIQNGKLIGAVTHVFVQEPMKGYGIFIENMLKSS